jgi:PIN domain nuclease of toxin-antitoxin system
MVVLTHDIAIQCETLESFPYADPADRFLVSSCLVHELTLVTADRALLDYRPLSTLW